VLSSVTLYLLRVLIPYSVLLKESCDDDDDVRTQFFTVYILFYNEIAQCIKYTSSFVKFISLLYITLQLTYVLPSTTNILF